MINGAFFKCYIPKKINKGQEILEKENLIENLDYELANHLMRENSKLLKCFLIKRKQKRELNIQKFIL